MIPLSPERAHKVNTAHPPPTQPSCRFGCGCSADPLASQQNNNEGFGRDQFPSTESYWVGFCVRPGIPQLTASLRRQTNGSEKFRVAGGEGESVCISSCNPCCFTQKTASPLFLPGYVLWLVISGLMCIHAG